MKEDYIHYAAREFLKKEDWILIAGEYPNGSDDELHSLKIMDRYLARDNSPDSRRHSLNKLVPDLIAYKDNEFLIVEMKPTYSKSDEEKLEEIMTTRIQELTYYLEEFLERYKIIPISTVKAGSFVPCLGFKSTAKYPEKEGFSYILVSSLDDAQLKRY